MLLSIDKALSCVFDNDSIQSSRKTSFLYKYIIVINPICFYINFILIFSANYINTVNSAFVYRCNLNQDTYFARDLFDRNRYRAVSKSTYIFLYYNSRIFIFNLNLYICLCQNAYTVYYSNRGSISVINLAAQFSRVEHIVATMCDRSFRVVLLSQSNKSVRVINVGECRAKYRTIDVFC